MFLVYLKLLLLNVHFVISFEFYQSTRWNGVITRLRNELSESFVSDAAQELWIEQPLDNLDKNETRTWKMRYFQDLSMWKSGGPIILVVGGESDAVPARFGLIYELANETNAAVYFSEHRYYGKSIPIPVTTAKDFKYLDATQSLHDNANLLNSIKLDSKYNNSKVVVMGGSYSGNLAAWMKVLFPKLVDAVVASSAPVLAKKDFFEYAEVTGYGYKKYGSPGCYEKISKKFARYEELLKTESGIKQIKKELNICEYVDMDNLEKMILITGQLSSMSLQDEVPDDAIKICSKLNFVTLNKCFDTSFSKIIKNMKSFFNMTQWSYQTCNEFGYFMTGNSTKQPFTQIPTVDLGIEMCKALFGSEFDEQRLDAGIKRTNEMFGGKSPKVNNVVFVHGDMDPWNGLGIKTDLSSDVRAVVMEGASHCADYRAGPTNELQKKDWQQIKQYVKTWINT